MKEIINGKMYNTETAKCVGSDQYLYPGELYYCRETLYRKKNGEYFLHGEGGPASQYSVEVSPNNWSSGKRIIPMDIDEAKEWAEKNIDTDEYVAEFGEPEE